MNFNKILPVFFVFVFLVGCTSYTEQLVANHHAEAVLTKNNELQFRLKINDSMLKKAQTYKVKISIHNDELAQALGASEIIYGQDIVYSGEYLETTEDGLQFINMTPIALQKDLHPFEIQKMIVNDEAITVEVFNDQKVLARATLTNFSTQL
ncbi:hypothetical protein [Bacillus marasmi]|uniref:hypothetical protein n=1 Tax=Bacillus marasmi TaxID=1926279 RepID=UPI0011C974D8|nr:hypothetical protein [Bacillus marasmi]